MHAEAVATATITHTTSAILEYKRVRQECTYLALEGLVYPIYLLAFVRWCLRGGNRAGTVISVAHPIGHVLYSTLLEWLLFEQSDYALGTESGRYPPVMVQHVCISETRMAGPHQPRFSAFPSSTSNVFNQQRSTIILSSTIILTTSIQNHLNTHRQQLQQ